MNALMRWALRWLLQKADRQGQPDYIGFMASLRRSAGVSADYDEADMQRDFRRVFMSDESGRRVLYQIFDWGGMFAPGTASPIPPPMLERHEGRREMCHNILAMLNAEVAQPTVPANPAQQIEEDKDGGGN